MDPPTTRQRSAQTLADEVDTVTQYHQGAVMGAWLDQVFQAGQVDRGGVVRRSVHDVEQYTSLTEVVWEAKRRNFHVIETGDQIVILCHEGSLVIHC